ncbi:MAG TPA: glycosyltransferase family 2 protein [Thermoanaerobaculia bacterium]|nr:glycosyltransferase family 2 protein [Thermoanaerobaculia bacterium]
MKLIIQIPAYNEEATIARTIAELPKKIDRITSIEILVVDDGSRDGTVEAARKGGAHHVVRLRNHRGLATAFVTGIQAALQLGADIIVNTDADNQYQAGDIPKLIAPIAEGSADVVIGVRDIDASPHMSPFKKWLQRFGSRAVGIASGIRVPDATSGLRAFSREAAYQINVFNPFTYTLETIIQAGNRNLEVRSVSVRTNPPTRPSRLYKGIGSYVRKSAATIFRVYTIYKPLKTFFALGLLFLLLGVTLGARFVYYLIAGDGSGHVQSLILASVFLIVGFQTWLIGLVADLISVNRRLSEEMLIRMKKLEQPADSRRQRGAREREARRSPAQQLPAETQWVWLVDETRIDERTKTPADEPSDQEPPTERRASSSARRRRRRRGGIRPNAEHATAKERLPHGHGRGETPSE